MKKNKLIAVAALLFHVMTFSVPQGLAADGWVVMDNDGNVISQNDGNTTNVNVVDGSSYTVVNGDIALDQIININVLNSLGIADAGAKAVFNFNDGQASVWEGVLNLVGTAAFINAMGFDVAASFEGNVSGGAILSSLGINEAQFFAGIAELARGVNDPAAVINNGTWNVDPQSFLALVGSAVHNLGQINANGGAAVLAAGDKVTLDLTGGNGLISVAVDQAINAPVYDRNGNKISDVISNSGVIRANGGLAVLSAKAAESLFDNIVNHSGIIEANSLSTVNGRIILDGGDQGVTNVTGVLNAQGDNLGEKGGTVQVLGKKVGLFNNALVNVSGFSGGGTSLIGGDYQGLGSVRNADATYIGQGVTIKADALDEGDGGKIIVWSDNTTRAYGTFSANGGSVSGNGGLVETSGKEFLDVEGADISASATNGLAGTWLLDPRNVEVVSTGSPSGSYGAFGTFGGANTWYPDGTGNNASQLAQPSQIRNTQIESLLNAGTSVTISTYCGSSCAATSNGNISVLAPISKTSGGDAYLRLTTDPYSANIQNILINAAITSTSGKLDLDLIAKGAVSFGAAAVIDTLGGFLQISGSSVTQAAGSSIKAGLVDVTTTGGISLNQAGNQFSSLYIDSINNGNIDIADSGTPTSIIQMMTNGGSINYAHTGSGDVTVGAGSTVRTNNGATAGGNITMNTSHGLSFDAASVVKTSDTGGGTVNVTGATVLTTPIAGAGTTITLNGGAPDTVIDFTISGPVSQATNYIISATRDILGQATVTTTGGANVVMTADSDLDGLGGVWIESAGGINSSGDVTLTGSAINKAGAGNGLSVFIENDGANRQIQAAGNINLLSSSAVVPAGKGGVNVQGIVETTGVGKTINIDSKGAVVTNNSGPMLIGDNVTIKSVGGTNVKVDADNLSYNNSGGGTVAIEDFAGGLTITGASNVGGLALSIVTHSPLTIAANIIQAAAISLTAGEAAGAGDDLTVNSGITVQSTGSSVDLSAGDNIVLQATSNVQAASTVTLTAASGDTDNAGTMSLAGGVNAGTDLNLNSTKGAITQTTGSLVAPGTTTITATGQNVTLNSANNNFATVSANGADVAITDISGLNLAASAVTGTLGVTANGAITDGGNLSVTGTATLAAGAANDITLNNDNNFSTVVVTTGKDVTLKDTGAINLGNLAVSGLLNVNAGGLIDFVGAGASTIATTLGLTTTAGGINDSGTGSVVVTGTTTLNATGAGNNITLDNANNNFSTVAVTNGNNVSLRDVNALDLGASTIAGTLGVVTNGAITDSGAVTVNGGTTLTAGAANNITMDAANNFQGPVQIVSGKDVTLNDTNGIDLNNSTISGLLAVTAGGLIDFVGNAATTVATTMGLTTTAGGINDSGTGSVTVTGTTTLAAGAANNITLNNANNNFSSVGITNGNNVTLNDTNGIILGTSTVSGDLGVTANGAITQSGAITANGAGKTATFSAGANNITLNSASNDFTKVVSTGGTVDLRDANALDLGATSATNLLVQTGTSLTDSGNITATTFKFTGGTTVVLDQAGNNFGTIAGTSNGTTTIVDTNDLTVGTVSGTDGIVSNNGLTTVTSGGNLTLNKAVNSGTNDVTLNATGFIREGVADDGAPVADVIGKNIFLNSQVAAPGDALGQSASYLDLQVTNTATGSWNVGVPNSGNVYINCIGDCPIGQVNVGTATFNFSTSGALLDGNDDVNGEFNGGTWNITAGGINIKTGTGFGTSTDAIETRLTSYGGVAGDGKAAVDGGNGGVFLANKGTGAFGLTIGGIAGSFVPGIAAKGGIKVWSGSPLTIAANVSDTLGGNILLAALGSAATDDLTLNADVSATGGNGNIELVAGDTVNFATNADATTVGTGTIKVASGEDFTDATYDQDGSATGDIAMNSTSTTSTAGGTITFDARRGLILSLANATAAGVVSLLARTGAITDANAASNNVTGTSLTATAATGIDLDTTIATLTSANVTGTGAIDINDLAGGLAVTSATTNDGAITINATGGNLDATTVTAGGNSRNVTLSTTTSGNVNVGNVTATGDNIAITSVGNIEELGADGGADLTSGTMNLTAATGIGNAAQLEIDATTLTNASTTGAAAAINLSDVAGGLAVTSATTTNGAITLNATGGNLDLTTVTAGGASRNITASTTTSGNVNVGNVTAAGDNIAITSVGNIEELGADGGADLTSGTMNLTAATGIGNAAQIEIDATTLTNASVSGTGAISLSDLAGGLAVTSATTNNGAITINATGGNLDAATVTAGGASNITLTTTTSGNVNVGNVTAAGDNIAITSAGSIEELVPDAGTDLTSGTMNLTAVSGIGEANQIEINATTLTNASTSGADASISLTDTAGGLVVTSATTVDGAITLNATSGNLTLNSVIAGGTGRNVTVSTTTSGNIIVGLVSALNDIANFTSAGTIVEAVNDDAGAITSDINAGTINLTTGGGDIGQFTSYLDITPTTLWNATSNGGDIYVNCIGACPMGQIDAGTGTFYYAGNITDGNDSVNGELAGGNWNIRAGGAHLDADNTVAGFIGTAANWIETRLSLYDGVANTNGRLVGTAGTGGIHMSNDVPANNALGLQIGGIAPSTITGITSSGNIEIYSFSPLVVAANVLATAGANILLAAMGNTTGDDMTVNANITASGGNGNISLIAGDDFNLNNGSIVSAAGTGNIDVHAGENFTDLDKTDRDGNATGDINMEDSNTAIRSQSGNIILDARRDIGLTEVNADSNNTGAQGDILITTTGGAVNDNDGGDTNLIGDDAVIRSVNGVGGLVNNTIETNLNSLDVINTTNGQISLIEVAGTGIGNGGALDVVRLQQNAAGDTFVRTTAGQMTVLNAGAGGFGVTTTNGGDLTLSTFGNGTNDLVINHNVSATNGGSILLTAADDIRLNDGAVVSAFGGGTIEAHGGEDFADNNSTDRDGNATSDIVMENSGTAFRTNSANITLDTRQNIIITEIDADENGTGGMGDIFITTTGGRVDDNNGNGLNLIGDDAVIRAVNGVGGLVNNTIETNLDTLDVINSTNGQISIQELASVSGNGNGDNLDLVRVQQTGAGTDETFIRTDSGALTVLATGAGGFGVSVQNGELTLLAQGAPVGSDDLNINNTVTSNNAKINLDSTDDVNFTVAGDVTSATGEIEVDAADDILMADNLGVDGTILNAGTGRIDLDAGGRVRLTSVQTNNTSDEAVVIVAGQDIIDGGDTDVDIRTGLNGGMILRANSGIGSRGTGVNVNPNNAANNFATDALDTQGGRLAARTETGDIQLANTGGLDITTLTDTGGGTPMGSAGAGTLVGVLNNDATHIDPASIIFITAASPITISSTVTNLDGGNISLYALGGLPTDTMTINANVQTLNGNGDVRVVSGGSMTMAPNVVISTQGDGVTSGTGRIAVGAGYDAIGKAADEAFAPGVTLLDPSASLFDTVGDANANLTMDELSRIWTEDGDILVDVQNVFTVGRVDADGNNDANGATASGLTDGNRGDITTFSRNGSTLDAEAADVGNLDFLANVLTMFSGDNIGLSTNHIEIDAPIFNAFAINNIFVDGIGNVLANMFSDTGSIAFTATGDILLGTAHAAKGGVSLTAGGSILSQGGSDIRIIANTPIALTAGGVIGTLANAINTQLNGAGVLLINAGSAINGISSNVTGNFTPLGIQVLNAPGLVLFNGLAVGGDSLSTLKTSIASLFQGVLPQILGQFGRFNGNVSPDFPGLAKLSEFGHVAEAPMDTTGVDAIGLPGVPATTAEQRRPAAQPQQIPAPAVPQQQQPTPAPAVQTTTITPADATTPPTVVPIPDDAAPTEQELNVENQNRN